MATDSPELTRARKPSRRTAAAAAPAARAQAVRSETSAEADMSRIASRLGSDVYCVFDIGLNCLTLSENWVKISGFTAAEDIGEGLRTRIAPDHTRKVINYLMHGDTAAAPVRFQIKHEAGNWRWCELQLGEAHTHEGARQTQYKCLLRDVSEVAQLQSKLEKTRLEADLAIKSRSEFLANMSHELRTPLNAILGFAQMIENGTYGDIGHPKYHDYVGSIQESGSILLSKINDLLEIANIDAGHLVLNESVCDLTQVIRQAVEFHTHRAFGDEIHLRYHVPGHALPALVDRIRMLQVLTNVISNAIKYNRPGGNVDIYCEMRKDAGINIVIEDNGGGIPASHLQNILSAFGQDNSFFARSRDCVGLGLALSKEIVKLHQGRIEIESEPEKGTLLTIRLPKERTVRAPAAIILESPRAVAVD